MMTTGIDITFDLARFTLNYGPGVTGPPPEVRTLGEVRGSLKNPDSTGPEKLYAIAMDVARAQDRERLVSGRLLLGVVAYSGGRIGPEPVRSQGHIHAPSKHSNSSPPEVFEIWEGRAIIYMQESVSENPGRCFAVTAEEGEKVIVPPDWAHMVVNADVRSPMMFGAICDRDYSGYIYEPVRARGGLCFFPVVSPGNEIWWERNPGYPQSPALIEKRPAPYATLGIEESRAEPLYADAVAHPDRYRFVPYSSEYLEVWADFVP